MPDPNEPTESADAPRTASELEQVSDSPSAAASEPGEPIERAETGEPVATDAGEGAGSGSDAALDAEPEAVEPGEDDAQPDAAEPDEGEAAGSEDGSGQPRADTRVPTLRVAAPASDSTPFVPAQKSGLRRLWKALKAKPDLGQVGVAILIGALGFTAMVQVRIDDDELLERARRADLIEIFSDLQNRSNRLENEIRDLQAARSELLSGEASEQAAREQAIARQGQLGVLAGTLPAEGPGIVITIPQVDSSSIAVALLSVVQELRVAGAEAIEIAGGNGEAVRVGVNTYFLDADDSATVEIDGRHLTLPIVMTALGESRALAGSMSFGGSAPEHATVEEYGELSIDVVREPLDSEYARPADDND